MMEQNGLVGPYAGSKARDILVDREKWLLENMGEAKTECQPTDSNNDKPSILKSTREAKGLTLEIVHEATKIPMDALRAIEEGYSVRILSPFYYRGFIKIYAEFLGWMSGKCISSMALISRPSPHLLRRYQLRPAGEEPGLICF